MKTFVIVIGFTFFAVLNAEEMKVSERKAEYVISELKKFTSDKEFSTIEALLGEPDGDTGSAFHRFAYSLDNGTTAIIEVGLNGCVNKIYLHFPMMEKPNEMILESKAEPAAGGNAAR